MSIRLGNDELGTLTDSQIVTWLNEASTNEKRLREDTSQLWAAVLRAFDAAGPPMTVRQIFYALVSAGAIAKAEGAYKQVCYHVLQMRRRGVLPYDFVSDNTRWMRKPSTYDSLHAFLEISKKAYRRALWQDQNAYVEVWCEKDALAGVIFQVTEPWDVPLMVTRGFPSETFVYEAAQSLREQNKPSYVYYFGDFDPSGLAIDQALEKRLREFGATFHFERVAIQRWQIDAWGLPTRPTKKSDSRSKGWRGGSVELDAIPVPQLRRLVTETIEQHVDGRALEGTRRTERLERQSLGYVLSNLGLDLS